MNNRWIINFFLIQLPFLILSGCGLEDPSIGINADQIITIETNAMEVLADGQSEVLITANLGSESDANQSIIFRTEQGKFAGAAGFPDSNNGQELTLTASGKIARAILVTDNVENNKVTVSTSVGDYSTFTDLNFQRAYPDEMLIEPSSPTLNAVQGASIDLIIKLFRSEGKVSDQTRVNFAVTPVDTSQAVATIVPFDFATSDGTLTVALKNGSDIGGLVEVRAEVKDKNGAIKISQTTIIEIIE